MFVYGAEQCNPAIEVAVDIKPQSCPNPLTVGKKGVLPVAILGTEDFDVTLIDLDSVRLAGVAPLRSALEDVATPVGAALPTDGIETIAILLPSEDGVVEPIHGDPTPPFPVLKDGHHVRVEDEIEGDCVNVTYSFTWTPAVIAFFGGFADISTPDQKDRMRDAIAGWNAVTPGIEFTEVVGAPATLSVGTTGLNFGALGLGGGLFLHHGAGGDEAASHHLHDHLAVQNGNVSWHNGADLPPGGLFDYLTVAGQEIGHAIGLGHNRGDKSSVMFPFLSRGIRRTPNASDESSLDFLYPGDACPGGPGPNPRPKPGPECENCTDEGPDGFLDLTLKFDVQAVIAALGEVSDRECVFVDLTGNLKEEFEGTPIVGEDVVRIQTGRREKARGGGVPDKLISASSEGVFVRGDPNADGRVDISDSIFSLNYLFSSGPAPACQDAADANDDGEVDISDAVYVISFLFSSGPDIKEPYPEPGPDTTPDLLECEPEL